MMNRVDTLSGGQPLLEGVRERLKKNPEARRRVFCGARSGGCSGHVVRRLGLVISGCDRWRNGECDVANPIGGKESVRRNQP